MSPLVFVCETCGETVYTDKGEHLLFGGSRGKTCHTIMDRMLEQTGGKCPRCGRRLSGVALNVEVKPK